MKNNVICIKTYITEFTAVVSNITDHKMYQWINSLPTNDESANTYPTNDKMGLKAYYDKKECKVIVEEYYEGLKKRRAYCTLKLTFASDLTMLHIDFKHPEAVYLTGSGYDFEDSCRYIATLNTILDTNF